MDSEGVRLKTQGAGGVGDGSSEWFLNLLSKQATLAYLPALACFGRRFNNHCRGTDSRHGRLKNQ